MVVIAVQNKFVRFVRVRILLLNRERPAVYHKRSFQDIDSMNVVNEGAIFDDADTAVHHIHCVAVVFFRLKRTSACDGEVAARSHADQQPVIFRFIPDALGVEDLIAVQIQREFLGDDDRRRHIDIVSQRYSVPWLGGCNHLYQSCLRCNFSASSGFMRRKSGGRK